VADEATQDAAAVATGPIPTDGSTRGPLPAGSVGEVQARLSQLWAQAAAVRLEAARAEQAAIAAHAESAARAAAALAAADASDAEGRHVAARSSVLNLVVIAGDRAMAKACAATIAGTAGRHPSRSLILSEEDPDGAAGLEASVEAIAVNTAGRRADTGAEMVHVTARGETGRHLASIVVPLLVHDLPVALWWPGQPALISHRADRLLPIADRLIVNGSGWAGSGLDLLAELAYISETRGAGGRLAEHRPLVVVDFALLRQSRWREALASVYDLPDLRPHLGAVRSINVTYAACEEGDPDGRTNVVRPLYHVAWLASRLGMSVVDPLTRGRDGHRTAALRQRDHQVAVSLRPTMSDLGEGSTVRVELVSRLRGAEVAGVVTAGDCTVEVVINDAGRERVRRTYNAPRLNDVDLLVRAVSESGADPLGTETLEMARRILGAGSRSRQSAGEDWGASVGEPWSKGGGFSHGRAGSGNGRNRHGSPRP
jgi:glucose-6-phosphate dehydrogenase assembly protein OpcA